MAWQSSNYPEPAGNHITSETYSKPSTANFSFHETQLKSLFIDFGWLFIDFGWFKFTDPGRGQKNAGTIIAPKGHLPSPGKSDTSMVSRLYCLCCCCYFALRACLEGWMEVCATRYDFLSRAWGLPGSGKVRKKWSFLKNRSLWWVDRVLDFRTRCVLYRSILALWSGSVVIFSLCLWYL